MLNRVANIKKKRGKNQVTRPTAALENNNNKIQDTTAAMRIAVGRAAATAAAVFRSLNHSHLEVPL